MYYMDLQPNTHTTLLMDWISRTIPTHTQHYSWSGSPEQNHTHTHTHTHYLDGHILSKVSQYPNSVTVRASYVIQDRHTHCANKKVQTYYRVTLSSPALKHVSDI